MPLLIHFLLLSASLWGLLTSGVVAEVVREAAALASASANEPANEPAGQPSADERRASREKVDAAFGVHAVWDGWNPRDKALFYRYVETADEARRTGDEAAAWGAAEAFVYAASPSTLRSGTANGAAKFYAGRGDWAKANRLLDFILANPAPDGTDAFADAVLVTRARHAVLGKSLGNGDDPAPYLERLKTPKQKIVSEGTELYHHYEVANLHGRAGDHERARMFYLAARPPAGDAAAERRYLFLGNSLATDLFMQRQPAAARNFQLQMFKKYPGSVTPQMLQGAVMLNIAGGEPDTADGLADLLVSQFPNSKQAAQTAMILARRQVAGGQSEAAAKRFRSVLESPAAGPELQLEAANGLLRMGVDVDPKDVSIRPPTLEPRPDPLFSDDDL